MFYLTRGQFLIVALAVLAGSVESAPILDHTQVAEPVPTPAVELNPSTTTPTAELVPTTTGRVPVTRFDHANYVLSEREYLQLLERLQREAQESVLANPGNYVDADLGIEEINRLIEQAETNTHNQVVSPNGATLQTTGSLETSSTSPVNLDSSNLASINSISSRNSFSAPTTTQPTRECPICLETIDPGDSTLELRCRHQFHSHCIYTWARNVSALRHKNPSHTYNFSCAFLTNHINYFQSIVYASYQSGRSRPNQTCPVCRRPMLNRDYEFL